MFKEAVEIMKRWNDQDDPPMLWERRLLLKVLESVNTEGAGDSK